MLVFELESSYCRALGFVSTMNSPSLDHGPKLFRFYKNKFIWALQAAVFGDAEISTVLGNSTIGALFSEFSLSVVKSTYWSDL